MKITITLTAQELQFLQTIQQLINEDKQTSRDKCTLEDVIHQCITSAISLGADTHRGHA